MVKKTKGPGERGYRTDWDPLAAWYDGWVGESGSKHHRNLAIPAVLDLLRPEEGERILDVGSGQGVLCSSIVDAGAVYTGVDLSPKMVQIAKERYGEMGTFLLGDAQRLEMTEGLPTTVFDAIVFLLSLQDIERLGETLGSSARLLRRGGRLVILLTHPCFRIPRQSGWGWDESRKLRYRRVDSYLTRLEVPLKAYPGREMGKSRSFHRPLQDYFMALSEHNMFVDHLVEIPTYKQERAGDQARAINRSNKEIPLFLAMRAIKITTV